MRQRLPAELRYIIMGSFLAHGAAVAVLLLVSNLSARPWSPPQTVLMTKLVRLGEERPKEMLPRKEEPPPPPTPPPAPVAAPAAPSAPSPKPAPPAAAPKAEEHAPSARERIAEMSRRNKALERLKEKVTGAKDGDVDGEVSEAELAVIGSKYLTQVQRCLHANYTLQGVDPQKVAGLKTTVWISVQSDGHFVSHKIEQSSGNTAVDQAVERAIVRCGQVSPPPPEIRDAVRDDGIEVLFNSSE